MNEKKYFVNSEVALHMQKSINLLRFRDFLVPLPFTFKKCVKLTNLAAEEQSKYWIAVSQLHPRLVEGKGSLSAVSPGYTEVREIDKCEEKND